MTTLSIAKDFTPTPGGRYRTHGNYSGQEFREEHLAPAYEKARRANEQLVVLLDGVVGLPASFLEEAFGGFVRENKGLDFSGLKIEAKDPTLSAYVALAEKFMREAKKH